MKARDFIKILIAAPVIIREALVLKRQFCGFFKQAKKVYKAIEEGFFKDNGEKLDAKTKRGIFKKWARAEYRRRTGKASPRGWATEQLDGVWLATNPYKMPKSEKIINLEHIRRNPHSVRPVKTMEFPVYHKKKGKASSMRKIAKP